MTLGADGVLETPHDLAAERVAAAFGGYCSCLGLADAAPGLLREAVGLMTRRTRPRMTRRQDGRWTVAGVTGCGCPAAFRSAWDAAEHARSVRHLAAQHGLPERTVRSVVDGLALVLPDESTNDAVAARVRETGGAARLWAAGVHPDETLAWSRLAAPVTEPLPLAFYLGLAYGPSDHGVVGEALGGRPDAETAAWLAWLPAGVGSGATWRAFLAVGLPRRDVLVLVKAGLDRDALDRLVDECDVPAGVAARLLAAWVGAGCRPDGVHVRLLVAHGLAAHRPASGLLDRLVADTAGVPAPPSRTELGVMAALVGGRAGVVEALARGVRSARELVETMEET